MDKVIIDSSTWVSYFIGLRKNALICQQISKIIYQADKILIPEIIYAEVLNVMRRFNLDKSKIEAIKDQFNSANFIKYNHRDDFWFKKLEFYMDRVKLDTQDLIILASALEEWPCDLKTGDKKLKEAYNLLTQDLYEK